MTLRELTLEEEAVFDTIVAQREKAPIDKFIYDASRGDDVLRENGMAVKLGIGYLEIKEIVQKMASDGIIDADWQTNIDSIKNDWDEPEFMFHSNKEIKDSYDTFRYIDFESPGGYNYNGRYFMDLSFARIKTINDTCRKKYSCKLSYDETKDRFVVECDNGKKLIITKLKSGMPPFEILKFATKRSGEIITRDDLRENDNGNFNIRKKSLATRVFDEGSIVRNGLSPFVKLSSDGIRVNKVVKLTLAQLEKLEELCF